MNPFKQLLKRSGSQPPIGIWLMSASPMLAEAAGHAGFDWGVIDMEHGPLDMGDVVHLLQAVAATKLVPIELVPFVQTAEEAAAAVAATRYPPQGVRGMAGMCRAALYGTASDHFATANRRMAVIVQLETEAALNRLEEIAAVDGVDALFVGPADLSGSMGLTGKVTHPKVMAAMADAARRCRAAGKPVGTIGGATEGVAQFRAMGYGFLAAGSDIGHFVESSQKAIQSLHSRETEHVHDLAGGTRPG